MPETDTVPSTVKAAQISARNRRTATLVRQLLTCRPLTPEQRDQLVRAAAGIPVVTK